jgi:hypothetical protein
MIDPQRFFKLIGKPSDSPEVTQLLSELSAPKPRLKKKDVTTYVALPKLGIDLAFNDEAHHAKRKDIAIGEGALILVSVALRSNVPKYTDYAGPLPQGLSFGDTQAQVHQKLGAPKELHDFLPVEFWAVKRCKLSVTYDEKKTKVEEVSVDAE